MGKKQSSKPVRARALDNQRRTRASFAEVVSSANRRAHEQANRRGDFRSQQYLWVASAAAGENEDFESVEWLKRCARWVIAVILLPLAWVTMWTFLSRFAETRMTQEFWKTQEFWYFATGALVMIGWFWCGLLHSVFLYLYVLGHELTHAVFVLLFRGKVSEIHISTNGGYITTNKTNLLIALSPYFVPFWAVVGALIYLIVRWSAGLPHEWDRLLYGMIGFTWTFHMVWTLWMIPRDQPDLKENGTFLSLVIIYLANVLVLAGLRCVAADSPVENAHAFAMEWIRHAVTWGDVIFRWCNELAATARAIGRF